MNSKQFDEIADYAMLNFSDKEKEDFSSYMQEIIDYTNSVAEYNSTAETYKNRKVSIDSLREDIVGNCLEIDTLMRNTDNTDGSYWAVERRKLRE